MKKTVFLLLLGAFVGMFSQPAYGQYPPVIDLGGWFEPVHGSRIQGPLGSNAFPTSMAQLGDFNGDGIEDMFFGYRNDGTSNPSPGLGYVVFGRSNPDYNIKVDSLDGTNGFRIVGLTPLDETGFSVDNAGDLNNDGIDDLVIGARQVPSGLPNQNGPGQAYVIFGGNNFPAVFNLSTLNGINGFTITGEDDGDEAGYAVGGAGDVNNDGIDDLLVGAPELNSNENFSDRGGECYVIFGKNTQFASNLNVTSLNGSNGFRIHGQKGWDFVGGSVSGVGDINNDGIDDFAVGAGQLRSDPSLFDGVTGLAVFFGQSSFPDSLHVNQLNGSNGFKLLGTKAGFPEDVEVARLGDFNGDGIDDLAMGTSNADINFNVDAGAAYIVFGASTFPDTLSVDDLNGSNGIALPGLYSYGRAGEEISGQVDLNADGRKDLIMRLGGSSPSPNEVAVLFGAPNHPASVVLDQLNGSDGFRVRGGFSGEYFGFCLSGVGDFNNDGRDDLAVGSPGSNFARVLFGSSCWPLFGRRDDYICDSIVSQSGNQVWTSYGLYRDTIVSSIGCDSIIETSLSDFGMDTSVYVNNNTLVAGSNTGKDYQWVDCNNGFQPIAGEVSQSFTPTQSGSYAVETTYNGCTQRSGCHTVILVGAAASLQEQLQVVHQPGARQATLLPGNLRLTGNVVLHDVHGRQLQTWTLKGRTSDLDIPLPGSGVYFLRVQTDQETATFKLLGW